MPHMDPRSWRIGLKLGAGFAVVLSLMVTIAITAAVSMARMAGAAVEMVDQDVPAERLVREWHSLAQLDHLRVTAISKSFDAGVQQMLGPEIEASSKRIDLISKELGGAISSERGKPLLLAMQNSHATLAKARGQTLSFKDQNLQDEALQAFETAYLPAWKAHKQALQNAEAATSSQVVGIADRFKREHRMGMTVLLLGSALAIIAGVALAWLTVRAITRPLTRAISVAQRVSEGDLTIDIESTTQDETGVLLNTLKVMVDNLRQTVGAVRSAADSITTASAEVATGNQDLSHRTEQAASNLQQTNASMTDLSQSVSQNSLASQQAQRLAADASANAQRGGDIVSQVVHTMSEISQSSRRINEIIAVIDGIAFQTNILALNASVEAARAGEQGRGFAVVAGEVRTLAQRSASAAKEIKTLILASGQRVDAGQALVDKAGQTMHEIVASVQNVTTMIESINQSTQTQAHGIHQITAAVSQLDQMTQQNAALVEQSAAASESLREQAKRLSESVGVFQLSLTEPAPDALF